MYVFGSLPKMFIILLMIFMTADPKYARKCIDYKLRILLCLCLGHTDYIKMKMKKKTLIKNNK